MKKLITTTVLCLLSYLGFSQEIVGAWTGELDIQGMKLPLIFNIKESNGNLSTTLDSPKQGAKDIPVKRNFFQRKHLKY